MYDICILRPFEVRFGHRALTAGAIATSDRTADCRHVAVAVVKDSFSFFFFIPILF